MSRTLHVEEWGEPGAPRVVYLHGVTGHGRGAQALAEGWLADRFRVLAPDLLGHGSSPYEPPRDIDEHVDAVVASVGDDPAVWIGHSFGGRLAFERAAREPRAVEKLVLLDPALLVDPAVSLYAAENGRAERVYDSFEEAVERRYVESALRSAPRELVEAELRKHLVTSDDGRWRYRYSQAAVVAAYGTVASPPPPFDAVMAPTLLILGRHSYVPYDHLLDAHRAALGELLEVLVVESGHTVLWDALEETAAAISAFLGP
jgi:lipase